MLNDSINEPLLDLDKYSVGHIFIFFHCGSLCLSKMLDEVDTLNVERNTLSGYELLSYIGFEMVNFLNRLWSSLEKVSLVGMNFLVI
jgi:hypothetical protein